MSVTRTLAGLVTLSLAFCTVGCSEPRLDLHLLRRASAPVRGELVEPSPCVQCVTASWLAPDGTKIDMEIEQDPFLSVAPHRLSKPEIVHSKFLYRPYCDNFALSFFLAISVAEMTTIVEKYGRLPAVAMVNGNAIDAGRGMFRGESLTFSYTDQQKALDAAALLGATPTLRESDDTWIEGARKDRLAILDELFANPKQLRSFAEDHGVKVEDLKKDEVEAKLFCQ
jgi:hypothetical protein